MAEARAELPGEGVFAPLFVVAQLEHYGLAVLYLPYHQIEILVHIPAPRRFAFHLAYFGDLPQHMPPPSPQYFMQTFLASVKKRMASKPPSRPTPDCFTPPMGTRKSRSIQQFTQMSPASSRDARRWQRDTSRLHREAASP